MNDNLITLSFKGKPSCISDPAWQYDYGQVAVFEDIELDEIFEVHFSNTKDKGLASVHLGENNRCEVPAGYFMTGLPIYGWVYVHPTLGSGETEYSFVIPVKTRPEPSPEENIPEPDLSALTHAVDLLYNALDDASASAEEAAGSAAGAKQNSEAYAVGTRDGVDVGSGDPTYHNNSKYYAEQAGSEAIRALRAVTFTINEEEGTLEVTIP